MTTGGNGERPATDGWDRDNWSPRTAWAQEDVPWTLDGESIPVAGAHLTPGQAAELELRSHFGGKRDGPRQRRELEVLLRGRAGRFAARTVDVSRSGVLLRITDPIYAHVQHDLTRFIANIERHFRTRVDVRFVEAQLSVAAEVARLTVSRADIHGEDGRMLMACHFRTNLTPVQCHALGIDPGNDV